MAKHSKPSSPSKVTVNPTVRAAIDSALEGLLDEVWLELPRLKSGRPYPPVLLFSPSITTRELLSFGVPGMSTSTSSLKKHHDVLEVRKGDKGRYWVITATFKGCSFFANTSKMSCPSWSTPAGHPTNGGTCPAAGAMLDVKPMTRGRVTRRLELATGLEIRGAKLDGNGRKKFVCDYCYAGKANYANSSVQMWQRLRHGWFLRALRDDPELLVEQLVRAILHNREYLIDRFGSKRRNPADRVGRNLRISSHKTWQLVSPDYFRVYDSGDFHSPEAVAVWCEVARRLPYVAFWAPTRMWWHPDWLAEMPKAPPNLMIRPSALHFEDPPPRIAGLAGGTGVSSSAAAWQCPVYRKDAKTCAKAKGPGGKAPCRVCWGEAKQNRLVFRDVDVSYKAH